MRFASGPATDVWTIVLVLLVLAGAIVAAVLVVRSARPGAGPTPGPLSPGRLAYELAIGVGMMVVGGLLLLAAAWFLLVALFIGPYAGGGWPWPLLPGALFGLLGVALALAGRRHLLRF